MRLFKGPGVFYVDMDPGDDYDWNCVSSRAVAYTPPPPKSGE